MSDIFLSYAHEDKGTAQRLANVLAAQGWSVFWDPRIPTGKKYRRVIDEELGTARCVVVLWSKHSIVSDWVLEEAEDGQERGILVPVLVEDVQPPLGFRQIQAARLPDLDSTHPPGDLESLLQDIAHIVGPQTAGSTEAPVGSPVDEVEDACARREEEATPAAALRSDVTLPNRRGVPRPRYVLLCAALAAALTSGLVTLVSQTGSMRHTQDSWADAISRVFHPMPSGQVLVVGITDADYNRADLFAAVSPLDPAVLLRLFERLAQHRPAVVAVDIALQPPPYELPERRESRRQLYRGLERLAETGTAHWVLVETPQTGIQDGDSTTLELWYSLHELATRASSRLAFASPVFPVESGVIRRVQSCWGEGSHAQPMVSVFGAVIGALDPGDRCTATAPGLDLRIRYTGGFASGKPGAAGKEMVLTASEILQPAEGPSGDTVLTGKTLIVGGLQREGRDTYWTPFGTLFGAEIWAEAVDTWRRGDVLHEPSWLVSFGLRVAIGMLGGWLSLRLGPVLGYVATLLMFGTLVVVFSWLSPGLVFVVVSALPVFVATLVAGQHSFRRWRPRPARRSSWSSSIPRSP